MLPAAELPGSGDEVRDVAGPVRGGEDRPGEVFAPGDWRDWPDLLMQTVDQANDTMAQWRRLRQWGHSPRLRLSLGCD
jgi:hypothetical protein